MFYSLLNGEINIKIFHISKKEIDKEVSNIIINLIKVKPNCVLGLATGSTPVGVYERLIEEYKSGNISFKDVTTFNLDEYLNINEDNYNSYKYFMRDKLFNHIDINIDNTFIPDSLVSEDEEAMKYDELIDEKGGIDLQILGLGSDGHIGFNEPGTSFSSLTHIQELNEKTIVDNSRFFDNVEDVPTKAVTMGLKSIMNSRQIILIIYGENKKQALNDFIYGDINESIPCSILKKHPNLLVYIDETLAY